MPRWGMDPVTFTRADTIQSALGKLDRSENSAPIVVLASDCRIADSVVLYSLLARRAKRFGLPIAVVSAHPYRRRLAREQGLYAFGSLGALKRARGRSPISWLENLADSLFFSMRPTIGRQGWICLGLLSLVAGVLAYLFLPQMTVTVRTPVDDLSARCAGAGGRGVGRSGSLGSCDTRQAHGAPICCVRLCGIHRRQEDGEGERPRGGYPHQQECGSRAGARGHGGGDRLRGQVSDTGRGESDSRGAACPHPFGCRRSTDRSTDHGRFLGRKGGCGGCGGRLRGERPGDGDNQGGGRAIPVFGSLQ